MIVKKKCEIFGDSQKMRECDSENLMANVHTVDNKGSTALHFSAENDHEAISEANVNRTVVILHHCRQLQWKLAMKKLFYCC